MPRKLKRGESPPPAMPLPPALRPHEVAWFGGALHSWLLSAGRGDVVAALDAVAEDIARFESGLRDLKSRLAAKISGEKPGDLVLPAFLPEQREHLRERRREEQRLRAYLERLGGYPPLAPMHDFPITVEVLVAAYRLDESETFFERLATKLAGAQALPEVPRCTTAMASEYVAALAELGHIVDHGFQRAARHASRVPPRAPDLTMLALHVRDIGRVLLRRDPPAPDASARGPNGLTAYSVLVAGLLRRQSPAASGPTTRGKRRPRPLADRPSSRQAEAWAKYQTLQSFKAVGAALGISGEAARKRVRRGQAAMDRQAPARSVKATRGLRDDDQERG